MAFSRADAWNTEFLYRIFQWNTEWFNNDENVILKNIKVQQIIGEDSQLLETLLSYENIEEYYKVMKPLMIHEFFHTLLKDNEEDPVSQTFTGTITDVKKKHVENIPGKTVKVLTVEGSVGARLIDNLPRRGDLLYVFYGSLPKIFGYVDDIVKQRSIINTKCVFKIIINNEIIGVNKEIQFTTFKSIQQNLRVVKALAQLPDSFLYSSILKPNWYDYCMCDGDTSTILPLLFDQKLNDMQLKIVADIVKTDDNLDPKICLVQGPPGTGKSTAIIAMITELMKKNSNRKIILCAPSNKAIDAVLSKLLDAQIELEKKDIKLNIVRVGREEKMDPKVKRVSLSNLALGETIDNISLTSTTIFSSIEEEILLNADIIASTLTSSFTTQMENVYGNRLQIPICIIDEAGQSIEIESLIPLLHGVETLILVGDPQQLPPTIISREAKTCGLDLSLFARAQKYFKKSCLKNPIQMLNVQYRMTDEIAMWPNKYFYGGAIKNAANVKSLPLYNYKILNHDSPQSDTSFSNINEATIIFKLLDILITNLSRINQQNNMPSISVITPYQDQRKVILNKIHTSVYVKISEAIKSSYEELEKYDDKKDICLIKELSDDDNSANRSSKSSFKNSYREKKHTDVTSTKGVLKLIDPKSLKQRIQEKIARSEKYFVNGFHLKKKNKVIVDYSDDDDDDDEDDDDNDNDDNSDDVGDDYDFNYPAITDKLSVRKHISSRYDKKNKKKKQTFFTKDEVIAVKLILNKITKMEELDTHWRSIEINTVDSFQGQEQDIIIMSCVRSSGIGFVADPNRLNVSLTRARHTMILCGNFHTFSQNSMWRDLIIDAENREVGASVDHFISAEELKKLIFLDK